jgi:hypothetical protein
MNDTKQQPESLRLADWLEDQYDPTHHQEMSAAELRQWQRQLWYELFTVPLRLHI